MKKLFLVLFVLMCLMITVSAKETVIYENDFTDGDLSDFYMKGTMKAENGTLKAVGSGSSAYISYDLPYQYEGMDYRVEVDYFGFSNMGGLLIGAENSKTAVTSSYFTGYTATTNGSGEKVYIAYFNETGWGGNFAPGTNNVTVDDIHMSVTVYKKAMTFRVTDMDGNLIQEFRYEPGDHENDIYDTITSTVGIRQYYADAGYFDNFKVTVIEDDVIPSLSSSVKLGDTAFKAKDLTVKDGVVSGSGVMLSEKALSGDYRIEYSVANKNISRFYFGMSDTKNGYALELDEKEQEITLFSITDGYFSILSKRAFIIREGYTDLVIDVHDGIASIYYNNFFLEEDNMPKIEFYLDNLDGKFGMWLDGGSVQLVSVGASEVELPEDWFINPVNSGADPDVLYYNGTYYLYVYENSGFNYFRLYTSPDLVHFTKRNYVFTWDPVNYSNVNSNTPWSPNVFYNEADGLFYLTFAAEQNGLNDTRRIFYAHSDSPFGPFVHEGPLTPINPDVNEIDGHAFVGYDGKTYMSFSRYDEGGTIWFEEIVIKDGVITAKPETATRVVVSDREWDNDGALRLCEGGFVWKHDGYYYLIYATGSYSRHYGEAVAVSKNPLGPYEKYDYNPVLNWNYIIDGPGDALIIPSPDGEELYFVHHRHRVPDNGGAQRDTCIALIEFVPDPDNPDGPDIMVVNGPTSTPQKMPSNKYRYDVNRDGNVTLADAMVVLKEINSSSDYSGYYDVDANGSIGMGDVVAIFEKIK